MSRCRGNIAGQIVEARRQRLEEQPERGPHAAGPRRHIENAEAGDTDRLAGQKGIKNGVTGAFHRLAALIGSQV